MEHIKKLSTLLVFILINLISFAQIGGINKFSFDIFKQINNKTNENIVIAPLSIYTSLYILENGANSKSLNELDATLNIDNSQNYLKNFNALIDEITNNNEKYINNNFILINKSHKINNSFQSKIEENFNAFVDNFSYKKKYYKKINAQISKYTNNKLNNYLKKGDIKRNTVAIILNTSVFNSNWKNQFSTKNTVNKNFIDNNGKKYLIPFMTNSARFYYKNYKSAEYIELEYEKSDFSFIIILPAVNYDKFDVLKKLEANYYNFDNDKRKKYIKLSMPKFQINYSNSLNSGLKKLGLNTVFSAQANFDKISEKSGLFINNISQASFIKVNEKGTEAGSVSSIELALESLPKKIEINRPFYFLIRHNSSKAILFIGEYSMPLTILEKEKK